MGNNMSSTYQKPENPESKSQENLQVKEDKLQVFMKRGPCKETYTAFQDCVEKAKEPEAECYMKLDKCMEAHSTYYQPFLAAEKGAAEVLLKELMPSSVWRYPVESLSPEEEKEAEKHLAYIKGGDCKESFTAWDDCEEATKSEDIVTKCGELFSIMTTCMGAHSDYYHQFVAANKAAEEHIRKELQAFLSQES